MNESGATPSTPPRPVRVLVVGDVVGRSGRKALKEQLPGLVKELGVGCVVVNGENAAAGVGLTTNTADELFRAGAHVITSGNHIWRHAEIHPYLRDQPRLLRPLNYPPGAPGRGFTTFVIPAAAPGGGVRVGVLNLLGRVFMDPVDCPFRTADALLEKNALGREVDLLIVDFHAEATSEKNAMGRHLDGAVTAVLGTHTHIPTADHRVLKGGTGYQTDIGMTGCYESVIGMSEQSALPRFLTRLPSRFEPAEGEATLSGVVVEADPTTGRCRRLIPIRRGGVLEPDGAR